MPPQPPPYTPHQGPYYPAPPPAYMAPAGGVAGFVPPTHVFPDSPPGKFKITMSLLSSSFVPGALYLKLIKHRQEILHVL